MFAHSHLIRKLIDVGFYALRARHDLPFEKRFSLVECFDKEIQLGVRGCVDGGRDILDVLCGERKGDDTKEGV